jgi:hypothetical protein
MVTVTNDWLNRLSDIAIGNIDDEIHEVAVGTGTGNESAGASSLANEVYRSNKTFGDCAIEDDGPAGEFSAEIEVTAGGSTANVSVTNPDNNDITEIGVFTKQGGLVVINEYSTPVTISSGSRERFIINGDFAEV